MQERKRIDKREDAIQRWEEDLHPTSVIERMEETMEKLKHEDVTLEELKRDTGKGYVGAESRRKK